MKISFDFDSCLSEDLVQNLARLLVGTAEVHIITSRCADYNLEVTPEYSVNRDLFKVANQLGISRTNIHFTEGDYKWKLIQQLGIHCHFDDMEDEVYLINANGGCAFLFNFDLAMAQYLISDLDSGLLPPNPYNKRID